MNPAGTAANVLAQHHKDKAQSFVQIEAQTVTEARSPAAVSVYILCLYIYTYTYKYHLPCYRPSVRP